MCVQGGIIWYCEKAEQYHWSPEIKVYVRCIFNSNTLTVYLELNELNEACAKSSACSREAHRIVPLSVDG